MEIIEAIANVGSELAGTAGSTAKLDFATASVYDPDFRRRGVLVSNTGASPLYLKIVTRGAAAPTVTSTNFHAQISVGSGPLVLKVRRSVDLYLLGSDTFTAVEVG